MLPYSSGIIITINFVKKTISSNLFDGKGCGFNVKKNFGTPTKKKMLDKSVVDTGKVGMRMSEGINSNR